MKAVTLFVFSLVSILHSRYCIQRGHNPHIHIMFHRCKNCRTLVPMNIPGFCPTSRILRVINCRVKLFLPATAAASPGAQDGGGQKRQWLVDIITAPDLVPVPPCHLSPRSWLGQTWGLLLWQTLAAINNKWFGAVNIFSLHVSGTLCLRL